MLGVSRSVHPEGSGRTERSVQNEVGAVCAAQRFAVLFSFHICSRSLVGAQGFFIPCQSLGFGHRFAKGMDLPKSCLQARVSAKSSIGGVVME